MFLCAGVIVPAASPADAARYHHIRPGRAAALRERVPVNIVFVGLERGEVDPIAFEARLPTRYRPVHRAASLLRDEPVFLGLHYTYDYRLHFASSSYEAAFFSYLAKHSRLAPITHWQDRYNFQFGRRDIDSNHVIDAPAVERWLAAHPPPGVSTTQNTVFLIDWYGRKGFRHHVYEKRPDADSDIGDPIDEPDTEFYVAWGGTAASDPEDGKGSPRRVWFYDLSAGPDYYSGNWDVSSSDAFADSRRIPVSWEYGPDGSRAADELSYDLADLIRYVAINLLFTTSPLYPPITTAKGIPASIDLDMNFYDLPGLAAVGKGSAEVVRRSFEQVAPWIRFSSEAGVADATYPEHALCWAQWYVVVGPSCYLDQRYVAEANLLLFHSRNRRLHFDSDADYEAGGFLYHVSGSPLFGDCYGIAEDDRLTGAQSFVYMFDGASCEFTMGWTDLFTHEFGHHVGLSHPHDGYDAEEDVHYGPVGQHAFAYVGTEVNSVMSYTMVNNEFSQFDADNLARWSTETYVRSINVLAERLIDAGRSSSLRPADVLVGKAARELAAHRYVPAVRAAKRAYALVLDDARAARVDTSAPAVGSDAVLGAPSTVGSPHDYHPALDRLCGGRFCLPDASSEAASFSQRR